MGVRRCEMCVVLGSVGFRAFELCRTGLEARLGEVGGTYGCAVFFTTRIMLGDGADGAMQERSSV
jgi:hypothetical protein